MSETITTLEPLRFPLHGRRLIEASAGTGKTYTIAALYLRLVLGHGGTAAFPRPLLPPEILVVTFTNAATRELRERIRDRLAEAARVFRGQLQSTDPFLLGLLAEPDYQDDDARALAARQLDLAAQWMDEAAIYTIHGWSQRMLNQHAFDSGSLFDQTLDNDEAELRLEAVRDYWRTFCYPLSEPALRALTRLARTPDALAQRVEPLLSGEHVRVLAEGTPIAAARSPLAFADELQQWQQRSEQLEVQAREQWRSGADAIEAALTRAVEQGVLSRTSYKAAALPEWFEAMRQWADGEAVERKLLERFAASTLRQRTNKKFLDQGPPAHAVFDTLNALLEQWQQEPDLTPILHHAAEWIRTRFEISKRRAARLGFDDLLGRLDQALAGPAGPRLAHEIAQQYPVALIDEFQDTDPVQYRSFRRIYATADPQASALLLIGDPKQAIYAFRGADIHTYLQARQDCADALYTLGTNFRSAAPLVAAVNRLFEQAEQARPGGAFRFARGDENPLPFHPVAARGRDEQLVIDGCSPAALTAWWLEPDRVATKPRFRAELAQRCASEIRRVLALAATGRAGLRGRDGQWQALKPSDIAVLVRTGSEAQAIRQALSARGVRSVYLSDRESVFATAEATDMWRWLRACAEPEQPALLHEALASATLGLDYAELDRLTRDEQAWEEQVELFRGLRQHWRRHGVLAAIRRLLDAFELPARLLQTVNGERVLTNLLHLAELLQAASVQLDGELALVRHLAEQLAGDGDSADERILRLESDSDRVQVITIHKSKGLEYPLVYLPFISDCRPVSGRDSHYQYHGEDGVVHLELGSSPEAQAQADAERLQEDLRLLYVALTRPVHACWIGLAPLKDLGRSALGQLLGGGSGDEARACFEALCVPGQLALEPAPALTDLSLEAAIDTRPLRPAQPCTRPVRGEHWWIASYSALCQLRAKTDAALSPGEREARDTARDDTALETRDEGSDSLAVVDGIPDIHRFPKGPTAGTFLHGILEWAASEGFARVVQEAALRERYLAPRCRHGQWQPWRELLERWLLRLLETPLPLAAGSAVALSALPGVRAEMEFWFSVSSLSVQRLDRMVSEHILPGYERPALEDGQVNGMLKGFIDLVFEYQGRYWVADYKSNWLGPDSHDYTLAAMRSAVLAKRYDLQYLLYTLALHRLLKARLPGYADDPAAGYERHVGGALYLFLRGIDEPSHHGAFVDRPPVGLILQLDQLLEQGEREVAHG